jgi:hypothetical protein
MLKLVLVILGIILFFGIIRVIIKRPDTIGDFIVDLLFLDMLFGGDGDGFDFDD